MQTAGKLDTNKSVPPLWLERFITVYQQLSIDNLTLLNEVYHDKVFFQDPLHSVQGKTALLQYFDNLYTNLKQCDFTIEHYFYDENQAAIYWSMRYMHPKLNRGKLITVSGHSHLKAESEQVIYHRDHLDAGAMLYEHIPLLGGAIRYLKQRVS